MAFRGESLESTAPRGKGMAADDFVHRHESNIVAISLVFGAGIAQAHEQ
jgi:hypothetical protein